MIIKITQFVDLKSEVIENVNLAHELANVIAIDEGKTNVAQKYALAMKLQKLKVGDEIEITPNDKKIIEDKCNDGSLRVIAAGQILSMLDNPVKKDDVELNKD